MGVGGHEPLSLIRRCSSGNLQSTNVMRYPVLKNEHVPKEILPIATARYMFLPFRADCLYIEQAVPLQALNGEQVFRPFAQLPSEPAVDRDAEAHLWPLNHRSRNIFIQHLPKRPL